MGIVFQAEDPTLKRFVALKVMRPSLAGNETARQRFLREARATAALTHDNIVAIYQVGEERGFPFFAMQMLEGETLGDYQERVQALSVPEVLRIAKEIADGLAAAHERGVVHRDIKPSNIWLEGERRRVKIVDFGLAREQDADVRLTQTGRIVGTPGYMSPEQVENRPISPSSDLFCLGCVLYRLCTGRDAFKGETSFDTLRSLVQDQPPTIRSSRLPAEFVELVMQLLAKKPTQRPSSAREVSETIQAIRKRLARPVAAAKTAEAKPACQRQLRPSAPVQAPPERSQGGVIIIGGLLVGLAVGGVYLATRPRSDTAAAITPLKTEEKHTASVVFRTQPPAADEKFIAAISKRPARQQVLEITQKLKELNPGFDGDLVRTLDANGNVNRVNISTDHVNIIWPLRGFKDLQFMRINGSEPGKGQVDDLSALKGLKLVSLECANNMIDDYRPLRDIPTLETLKCDVVPLRDKAVLQSIPSLKRINDKAVKSFWKDLGFPMGGS